VESVVRSKHSPPSFGGGAVNHLSFRLLVVETKTGLWSQVFQSGDRLEIEEFATLYRKTMSRGFTLILVQDLATWRHE